MSKKETEVPKPTVEGPQTDESSEETGEVDSEAERLSDKRVSLASAKHLPRPATVLPTPVTGDINAFTASLIGDTPGPTLEDVRRANRDKESHTRTPLLTVVEAIIRDRGGSIGLAELCQEVKQHWNRPFPTSPYTMEEFIFVMVRNSDKIRLTN